ncbi:MAG: DUF721 domain-containing protein [Acidobacteriota bacterium]
MKSVGSLLPQFLQNFEDNDELSLLFLEALWPNIVGDEVARKSRPLSLKNKTLLIGVPSQPWKTQLLDLQDVLIKSINDHWKSRLVAKIQLVLQI